jgi:hypothetical protein
MEFDDEGSIEKPMSNEKIKKTRTKRMHSNRSTKNFTLHHDSSSASLTKNRSPQNTIEDTINEE